MPHAEPPLAIPSLVDQTHDGGIGGDEHSAIGIPVRHEIHGRRIRQVPLEGVDGLVHQRHAIGQEQDPLGPVAAHQQLGESDHHPGLAGPGRHDQQGLSVMVPLKRLGHPPNGPGLVIPFDDLLVDRGARERMACRPPLHQQLELRLLVEPVDWPRRVVGVVPKPVVVPVGVENHRPLAEHPLQAIGVERGLLLADSWVAPSPLCFDQTERLAVVAPEDVVHVPLVLAVGHPGDLEFAVPVLIERPAGLLEEEVDEVVAGLRFRVVVGVRLGLGRPLDPRDFRAEPGEFGVHRVLVGQNLSKLLVLGAVRGLEHLELLGALLRNGAGLRQGIGVETQAGRRPFAASVGMGQPVADVEQLPDGDDGIIKRTSPVPVDGAVAERADDPRFAEHRVAGGLLEAWFVNQGGEGVLVRHLERGIVLVDPGHGQFQGAAGVEARGPRIRVNGCLSLGRGF